MMYICQICKGCVGPCVPQLKHTIMRQVFNNRPRVVLVNGGGKMEVRDKSPRTEVAMEIPVCEQCNGLLLSGVPLDHMIKFMGQCDYRYMPMAEPVKQPEPEPVVYLPVKTFEPSMLAATTASKKRRDRKKVSMEKKAGQEKQS